MATNGDVNITIQDGAGTVVTPGQKVQLVIGCCSGGVANQVVASTQVAALTNTVGYGVGPEAAALTMAAGGTVLFVKCTKNASGTATAVTFTGTGTSVITVTLDGTNGAFDDYNVQFKCLVGGTRGTTGITFQLSLDAGRTYGPVLALGTATSYTIPNTGVTLAFAAGTLVAGDIAQFSTCAPSWNAAGIQAALNAFINSPYALAGVGTIHIVGASSSTGGQSAGAVGSDATSIQGFLDTAATGFVYNRAIIEARDAKTPVAWGGTGETEATWLAAIELDYAAVSAKRICANGGYYNMTSGIPNIAAGLPRYRRPLAWALAAREVAVPGPQTHAGRVKDGSLTQIVVSPSTDPNDGFVYHDERITPGLDGSRFSSARTRVGLQGFYIANPNLMSPSGSDFSILPLGLVMDITCTITHQVGQQQINSDVRLNPDGTLYKPDAVTIQSAIDQAIRSTQVATKQISDVKVVVDTTNNVQTTSNVNITVTIQARGYILQETVTIGYGTLAAAA